MIVTAGRGAAPLVAEPLPGTSSTTAANATIAAAFMSADRERDRRLRADRRVVVVGEEHDELVLALREVLVGDRRRHRRRVRSGDTELRGKRAVRARVLRV